MNRSRRIDFKSLLLLGSALAICGSAHAEDRTVNFNVPAQPARASILEFAREANIQILISATDAQGKQTNTVRGSLPVREALKQLLAGTGITIRSDDGQTIVLTVQRNGAVTQWALPEIASATPLEAQPLPNSRTAPVVLAQGVQTAQGAPAAPLALPEQPPELVIVTGSLISGLAPVGLRTTELSADDFTASGAITVSDLLDMSVPAVIALDRSARLGGSNIARNQAVDIHGLGYLETLVLVDGFRIPLMNTNASLRDPSVVPAIALQRVDVFTDGASATYGADAVAGVINVVLRRNFDGAMTQARYQFSDGTHDEQFEQLFGRTWSSGGITLAGEWTFRSPLSVTSRSSLYGCDLTANGLGDLCTLVHSMPATIVTSTAANNPQLPINFPSISAPVCNNCFRVPAGQNGAAGSLTWPTSFVAGDNRFDPSKNSSIQIGPRDEHVGFSATVDQQITDNISFSGDAFWSNHTGSYVVNTGSNGGAYFELLKSNNPYYPVNGPVAGLNVFFDLQNQLPPVYSYDQHIEHVQGGLDFKLPFDWHGRVDGVLSEYKVHALQTGYNENNIKVALGQTVTATGLVNGVNMTETLTKPANIPYLNVFCDMSQFSCNDPATLAYIRGIADQNAGYTINQYEATADGKIFTLPGGDVALAFGGDYVTENYQFKQVLTNNTLTAQQPNNVSLSPHRHWYAGYGELRVPIIGQDNALPFVRRLEFDAAYRYDHYSDFGSTTNPQIRADLEVIDGVTFHGSYGKGFRSPTLQDIGLDVNTINTLVYTVGTSASGDSHFPGVPVGTKITGLTIVGSSGGLDGIGLVDRPAGYSLKPETSESTSVGVTLTPPWLQGLTASGTYYDAQITNFLNQAGASNQAVANPAYDPFVTYQPSQATIAAVEALPGLKVFPVAPIQFIRDGAVVNSGALRTNGLDYSIQYTTPIADTGDWNAGISGTEVFIYKQQLISGQPWVNYLNSDALDGRFPAPLTRRINGQLGWTNGTFSVEGLVHYRGSMINSFFPSLVPFGATPGYANVASYTTLDLQLGYNTGDTPANPYLRNISFNFVVRDITNKLPPFELAGGTAVAGGGGTDLNPLFSADSDNAMGRVISITVTKSW